MILLSIGQRDLSQVAEAVCWSFHSSLLCSSDTGEILLDLTLGEVTRTQCAAVSKQHGYEILHCLTQVGPRF